MKRGKSGSRNASTTEQLRAITDEAKSLRGRERFVSSILDSLTTNIAIIDEYGVIQYTNRAWRDFAAANGCMIPPDMVGINYLLTCECAGGEDAGIANAAASGIRDVLAGRLDDFTLEYPCHSPTEKRWFVMRVNRFLDSEPLRAVVAHENVTSRKLAEQKMERLVHYLGERTKELNCLYRVSTFAQILSPDPYEIVRKTVNLLPPAWQYPEITAARIVYDRFSYQTENFRETQWMQSADIIVADKRVGRISVCYLEGRPQEYEGPFLQEERYLIDSVAGTLGSIIERNIAEAELKMSEDKFAKAFHSSPEMMTISTLADERYLDVNRSFVERLGFSRVEAIGHRASELGIWVDAAERERIANELLAGETVSNRETLFRAKDGRIIDCLISAEIIELAGEKCLLAITSDITERKKVELEKEKARDALEKVYARERRIAETLQRNFLPDKTPRIEGYELADAYQPALDEAAIGGDVYDIFKLPNGKYGIAIADVSGKGLKAARYGAMVKYMLRAYSYQTEDPALVLTELNDSVTVDMDLDSFITCFYGILDPRTGGFVYANAGHEEPLLIPQKQRITKRLEVTGSALGLQPGSKYQSGSLTLAPGDILFFYTDGVTDARGMEPRMGVEGLEEYLATHCGLSAQDIIDCVLNEVKRRSGNHLADDVAMLALEVNN